MWNERRYVISIKNRRASNRYIKAWIRIRINIYSNRQYIFGIWTNIIIIG
jgi:hypothetical protein